MAVNPKLRLLIASTSTVHGMGYLEYARGIIEDHFREAKRILFVPYARPDGISHDEYTEVAAKFFSTLSKEVVGAHTFDSPQDGLNWADGVFIGGGNTFVLVTELYQTGYIKAIPEAVRNGMPYMGTSAGSNVAGVTMCTTNDMPIVYPPSFDTMALYPFNMNPHYLDPDPTSKHMGESRQTRIKEFHAHNDRTVVGLREGSCIWVRDGEAILTGDHSMRLFEKGKEPREIEKGASLNFLFD